MTLQGELSSEPEKNCRAYVWFMCKSHERRKRDLAQRSTIIQGIPGFWANVVSFLLLPRSAAQEEGEVQRQEQEEGWRQGRKMGAGGP